MRTPSRMIALILLVALTVPTASFRASTSAEANPIVEFAQAVPIAEDDDQFRQQMVGFLEGMDVALTRMAQHPALAETIQATAEANGAQIPIAPVVFQMIDEADSDQLEQLRQVMFQVPDILSVPQTLESVADSLPKNFESRAAQVSCPTNTMAQADAVQFEGQVRSLTRAVNGLDVTYTILATVAGVGIEGTQDADAGGFWRVVFVILVAVNGAVDIARKAVARARDDVAIQEELSQLCLASCLKDVDDEHSDPSETWRGRGCDNRDNNCNGTIDEAAEDLFPPIISIDAAILGQCFASQMSAEQALANAVNVVDDCSTTSDTVSVGAPVDCKAGFSVSSRDQGMPNTTTVTGQPQLTIDPMPPVVMTPTLEACYPTLDAARTAFTSGAGFSIMDCDPSPRTRVDVVEKECVADLSLTATDSCDNQTTVRDSARIDASPPVVNIERLTIPDVDGLSCFESEAEAVSAVQEATRISDQCTAVEDLVVSTTTSGTQCDLQVQTSAMDQCGNLSADALTVRVDNAPPVVTCSVAIGTLYPATDELVDVGFTMTATDECDPAGPKVDVVVTSDEPTALAYSAIVGRDPSADAFFDLGPDGSVVGIMLRSQRSKIEGADGRVYRIRVTATDSCGLSSFADCFVTVPRKTPGPGSAINSGQQFDATKMN